MGFPTMSLRPSTTAARLRWRVAAAENFHHSRRRARHQCRAAADQPPEIERMEAIDILQGLTDSSTRFAST